MAIRLSYMVYASKRGYPSHRFGTNRKAVAVKIANAYHKKGYSCVIKTFK